ncbi:hypothetical protein LPJ60_006606, partial [Coemansia sp. RSA 2675]
MALPSRFQTLPMPIVEKVVEYLEERTRTSLDGAIDRHNSRKTVLMPLLWVSERWREAVLNSVCDNCSLFFNNTPKGYEVVYPACLDNFSLRHFDRDKLVKRIVVHAPSWNNMCSRAFSRSVAGLVNEEAVFPIARIIVIFLGNTDDSGSTGDARSVTSQQNTGLCNILVSELCKDGVSRVEMDSAPGCSLPSFQLPGVSGLTGLIQGLGQ